MPDAALAAELSCGYYVAYHTMRRLHLDVCLDQRTGELVLTQEQADRMRAEFARVRALNRRAVKVSAVAGRLGVSPRTVTAMIRRGELTLEPETDSSGHRFVTTASVQRAEAALQRPPTEDTGRSLISLAVIRSVTGFSRDSVLAMIRSGQWERRDVRDRLHVTSDSFARWARIHRPDLLMTVTDDAT